MVHEEEKIKSQQTESFTSTLSHEMRTPLASCVFLLGQVIQQLEENPRSLKPALKYLNLSKSQLSFAMSFVDDLLDLRQLKEGTLTLAKDSFNPNETF